MFTSSPTQADVSPEVNVSIVFTMGTPTKPACDAPPQALEVQPIELSPKVAARAKVGASGWFTVLVDTDGTVHDLKFDPSAAPGGLAHPIRQALARWKFEPLRSGGEVKQVLLPLAYQIRPLPQAAAPVSGSAQPLLSIYRIEPVHIPELRREPIAGSSPKMITRQTAPITQVVNMRGPSGEIIQRVIMMPGPPTNQIEFFENAPAESVPWFPATIELEYEVNEAGLARNISVLNSSCPVMNAEVATAVMSWRFRPPFVDGKPVRSRVREVFSLPLPDGVTTPPFVRAISDKTRRTTSDEPPQIAVLSLPIYPTALASQGVEGKARAEVTLDPTGAVLSVESEGAREEFAQALRAAMFECRFSPATRNRNAIPATFEIEAKFVREPQRMSPDEARLPALHLAHTGDAPRATSRLDAAPRLIIGNQPHFRSHELNPGETGKVLLELTIDATGRVREPVVVSASHPALGYTAVQAAATWLFEPPLAAGKPVATRVRMPFTVPKATSP